MVEHCKYNVAVASINVYICGPHVRICYILMKNWTEFRTAFYIAKSGSISAAAEALSVHRATVLRHLDIIESELGTRLFLRGSGGYRLTDVGEDLLRVSTLVEEQLMDFSRRNNNQRTDISGEIILTSVDSLTALISPAIRQFKQEHPGVVARYFTSAELLKLEYGQAHVAFRTGTQPEVEDYVVQPFFSMKVGLYASDDYIAEHGSPADEKMLGAHAFVALDDVPRRLPVQRWIDRYVQKIECTSNSIKVLEGAVVEGVGIGVMLQHEAARLPGLRRVLPGVQWDINNWIVTHGDLHQSDKVQSFLKVIKSESYRTRIQQLLSRDAAATA